MWQSSRCSPPVSPPTPTPLAPLSADPPVDGAWTQGFFPGLLWLTLERERLIKGSLPWPYTTDEVQSMAREWQGSFRKHARKAINHDQGFRYASSYGRDLKLTGNEDCKPVLIEAADSLWDRYDPKVCPPWQRCCREMSLSWPVVFPPATCSLRSHVSLTYRLAASAPGTP